MHITKHTLTLDTTHYSSSTGLYMYGYGLPNGLIHAVEYERGNVPSTGMLSLYIKPAATHDPYMLNADCESATPPYLEGETDDAQINGTFARSIAQQHTGASSFLFTKTVAAGTPATTNFHTPAIDTANLHGLLVGHTYYCGLWLYIPSGGMLNTEIALAIDDYVGSWGNTSGGPAASYDAWQYVQVKRTIRADATGARAYIFVAAAASINETFYVDDVDFRHMMHRQVLAKQASTDSWIVFPRQGAADSTEALIGATTDYQGGMFVVRETDAFMLGLTGGTSAATTGAVHVYIEG